MKKIECILVVLIIVVFSGCKTTQDYYTKKGTLKNIADFKLINTTKANYLPYNTLFYKKFKATIDYNGDSKSFSGNIYINKDSSIIISILKGIEFYRVQLTPNAVEILDKRNKTYTNGDYKILWDKFLVEMDYHTLQCILSNELFVYPIGGEQKLIKRYKHEVGTDSYQLQSLKKGRYERKYKKEKTTNIIFHQFSIMPDVFKVSKVNINDFDVNSTLVISYDNFVDINNILYPSSIIIEGSRGKDIFSIDLSIEHIDIDGTNSLGFKFSDKYKQLNLKNEN